MDTHGYSIADLAADLKSLCAEAKDEREILTRGRPRTTTAPGHSWPAWTDPS
jgi:hypothetical protein